MSSHNWSSVYGATFSKFGDKTASGKPLQNFRRQCHSLYAQMRNAWRDLVPPKWTPVPNPHFGKGEKFKPFFCYAAATLLFLGSHLCLRQSSPQFICANEERLKGLSPSKMDTSPKPSLWQRRKIQTFFCYAAATLLFLGSHLCLRPSSPWSFTRLISPYDHLPDRRYVFPELTKKVAGRIVVGYYVNLTIATAGDTDSEFSTSHPHDLAKMTCVLKQ